MVPRFESLYAAVVERVVKFVLVRFEDRRLEKGGPVFWPGFWSWVPCHPSPPFGLHPRGEIRLTRFLRNGAVSVEEIMAEAAQRTAGRSQGRDALAI